MAWRSNGTNLVMVKGDYGIGETVTINGATFGPQDSLRFRFKNTKNARLVLVKDYSNIVNNSVVLQFTDAESALFSAGDYLYSLDWYRDGGFMCNLIPSATLKVVDKV